MSSVSKASSDIGSKMFGSSSSKSTERRLRMSTPPQGTPLSPGNAAKASAKRKRPNPGPQESGSEEDEVENPFNSGGISVGSVIGGGSRSRL